MKVRYRREDVTTILPGGHYYAAPRPAFEPEFCCELMCVAWDASIIAMDETPAVALAEITVDREATPRMVTYTGTFYPVRFCPFCGGVEVEREG